MMRDVASASALILHTQYKTQYVRVCACVRACARVCFYLRLFICILRIIRLYTLILYSVIVMCACFAIILYPRVLTSYIVHAVGRYNARNHQPRLVPPKYSSSHTI